MEHHTLTKYPSPESVDLLNLLHFPRVAPPTFSYPSVQGKAPLYSGTNTESFQLPQRLFQRGTEGARNGLLGDLEPEDASGKSKREGKGGEPRGVNHFATERQRREFLNEKYHTLRSLVPNPTKADRASIVADAIEYVKELKQMVQELQQSVEEKRRAAGDASSVKRRRSSMDGEPYNTTKTGGSSPGPENDGPLMTGNDRFSSDGSQQQQQRCSSSCLQRTSPNGAHVDVRVVHDEVTIKVNHRRRPSSLLFSVLAVLQDLQLDLFHASGASIGEHDVFLFNTKIIEGSSTFASYIAVKLLDTLIAIL